ncbi:MAG: heterodisulfide reductase-related iron-sulfur binding cluster [Promethearchaeota archaeon]
MTQISITDWKDIIHRCFRCGYCKYTYDFSEINCPSYKKYRFETYSTGGRLWLIYSLIKGELQWNSGVANVIYSCSTCGNCMENCRFDKFNHFLVDFIEMGRNEAVLNGFCPENHSNLLKRTMNPNYFNPYGEVNSDNDNLKEKYDLPDEAEWVYFIGCTSNYRQKNLRDATIAFLKKSSIDFTLIDEHCCTSPLLRTGQLNPVKDFMNYNIQEIFKAGASKVITSCAGCYRTLKEDFYKKGVEHNLEIYHVTEIINQFLKDKRIKFKSEFIKIITYHDPCHLGRHSNFYEPPREILKQIPGVSLIEMKRNKENAWCCGAGGGVKIGYPDWSVEISKERLDEAKQTGASIVVSTCPFCRTNLYDANKKFNMNFEILDLIELLDQLDYEIIEKAEVKMIFNKSNCVNCENIDCLTRCQYIEFENTEAARVEINKLINEDQDSRVLTECLGCFSCDEYCPYGAHPFDLINELQERYKTLDCNPAVIQNSIKMYEPHDEIRIKDIDPSKPVLNKCLFFKSNSKEMMGPMFDNLQYLSGRDFFCNLMYQHLALPSIIKERVPIIIDNFKKTGVKKDTEVICWHDECYGLYTSYCQRNNIEQPFKPVHIFEYVYNYLKDHESEISKLNIKAAYQRNCSNRYVPETDEWVDKICELIGVERVQREYDRENALCCAASFPLKGKNKLVRPTQNKNVKDMVEHGAEICIFNCPMCKDTLERKIGAKGMKSYFLSDLARMALGEQLDY